MQMNGYERQWSNGMVMMQWCRLIESYLRVEHGQYGLNTLSSDETQSI